MEEGKGLSHTDIWGCGEHPGRGKCWGRAETMSDVCQTTVRSKGGGGWGEQRRTKQERQGSGARPVDPIGHFRTLGLSFQEHRRSHPQGGSYQQTNKQNLPTPPPPEHSKCWQGYRRMATLGHCWWECEMGGSTVGKFNVESPYNPAPSLLSPQPGEREGAPGRTSVRPGSRQHCSQ